MRLFRGYMAALALICAPTIAMATVCAAPAHTEFIATPAVSFQLIRTNFGSDATSVGRAAPYTVGHATSNPASSPSIARAATSRHYDPG